MKKRPKRLIDAVKLLEGKTRAERRIVLKHLFPDGWFEDYGTGKNFFVKLGNGKKKILLGSHYDSFPGCPGANDNSSATAVLWGVHQQLKNKKMKNEVLLCIFDEEEIDCVGSQHYVRSHGVKDIIAFVDLELVGRGAFVGIWPIHQRTALVRTAEAVLKRLKQPYEIAGELPMFYADYVPFRQAGVDSLCLSMIPKQEVSQIRQFALAHPLVISAKVALGMMRVPHFFTLYHSAKDTRETLSEKSLQRMKTVVLKLVDAVQGKI